MDNMSTCMLGQIVVVVFFQSRFSRTPSLVKQDDGHTQGVVLLAANIAAIWCPNHPRCKQTRKRGLNKPKMWTAGPPTLTLAFMNSPSSQPLLHPRFLLKIYEQCPIWPKEITLAFLYSMLWCKIWYVLAVTSGPLKQIQTL